jgi:hypothetical protein
MEVRVRMSGQRLLPASPETTRSLPACSGRRSAHRVLRATASAVLVTRGLSRIVIQREVTHALQSLTCAAQRFQALKDSNAS